MLYNINIWGYAKLRISRSRFKEVINRDLCKTFSFLFNFILCLQRCLFYFIVLFLIADTNSKSSKSFNLRYFIIFFKKIKRHVSCFVIVALFCLLQLAMEAIFVTILIKTCMQMRNILIQLFHLLLRKNRIFSRTNLVFKLIYIIQFINSSLLK